MTFDEVTEALEKGPLPANFKQWAMRTETGWTVAHMAAERGHIPTNIPLAAWRLTDNAGTTVWDVAKRNGHVTGNRPVIDASGLRAGSFGAHTALF